MVPKRSKLIIVAVIMSAVLGAVSVATPKKVDANAQNCPDAIEGWYECWQDLATVRSQVDLWCAFADASSSGGASKRQRCEFTLYGQVDFTPPGIAVKDECESPETALKNARDCYVLIQSGTWRTALSDFSDECTFANPDPECSERIRKEFAEDNGWAEDAGGSSSSSNAAIDTNNAAQRSKFVNRLSTYIRWLTVGVGVLAVFGLVISGIQYAAAQENAQSVAAAKSRINNIIIGIVIYLTMFAMLQWLIPGGVFTA